MRRAGADPYGSSAEVAGYAGWRSVDTAGWKDVEEFLFARAGSGLFTAPAHGLSEIAAVGVLPRYRRQRIATVIGTVLSRAVIACGATPDLQTETTNEHRLYGKLGYRAVGELVVRSLPSGRV